MFVLARSVWLSMLSALATVPAGKLFGVAPKLMPYTNAITPGPDNVVGDFTAPVYTGYADQAVVLSGPFTSAAGLVFEIVGDLVFTVGTPGDSTTIQGFILKDSVLGYLGGVRLPAPVTLNGPGGTVQLGQDIQIDPAQLLGAPDVSP